MAITVTKGMKFQPVHSSVKWSPIKVTGVYESQYGKGTMVALNDPNMPDNPGCVTTIADVEQRLASGEWHVVTA